MSYFIICGFYLIRTENDVIGTKFVFIIRFINIFDDVVVVLFKGGKGIFQ